MGAQQRDQRRRVEGLNYHALARGETLDSGPELLVELEPDLVERASALCTQTRPSMFVVIGRPGVPKYGGSRGVADRSTI